MTLIHFQHEASDTNVCTDYKDCRIHPIQNLFPVFLLQYVVFQIKEEMQEKFPTL